MKRVISLYLPTWAIDRVRRRLNGALPIEQPVILIGRAGRKRVVTAADRAALALGICPGMAAAQAQALVSGLHIEDADPEGDAEALERLALWAYKRYSPVVAADSDGLYIDATGATHLFGGEEAMLADISNRLTSVGTAARVAMAPTYGAAHGLARFGRQANPNVNMANLLTVVRDLPIAALRLPVEQVASLRKLGFNCIGELEATPRAPLALRFGSEIGKRLDQLFGRVREPIQPLLPADLVSVRQAFAEPIGTPEALRFWINKLVAALCNVLEVVQKGARVVDMVFDRVDNRQEAIRIGLAKPMRDAKRLSRLLADKLETIDPGLGIEIMTLSAPWVELLTLQQSASCLGETAKPDIASLIDTLSNRLGPGHLYQVRPVESDVPERCIAQTEPLTAPAGTTWPVHWPRPTRLLARPEPVETIALLPDHPPVSFVWRGVRHKVRAADGPERIFGEWWRRDAELDAVRDYFQVEDEAGERFWLFRAGDGVQPETGSQNWYMHGVFA